MWDLFKVLGRVFGIIALGVLLTIGVVTLVNAQEQTQVCELYSQSSEELRELRYAPKVLLGVDDGSHLEIWTEMDPTGGWITLRVGKAMLAGKEVLGSCVVGLGTGWNFTTKRKGVAL